VLEHLHLPNGSTCRRYRKEAGASLLRTADGGLRIAFLWKRSASAVLKWYNFPHCAFQNRRFDLGKIPVVRDRRYSLQSRLVHHQHRDHAPEKHEQHNCHANKYSIANRVILLRLAPERRRISKICACCTWFGRPVPGEDTL